MESDPRERAARLGCWSGPVDPQPVGGGITNLRPLFDPDMKRVHG